MGAFVNRLWQQRRNRTYGCVSQLTHREKLPALPLTSREFVKAFTSDKK
ncbi:hypothetical protein BC793_103473 [Actinoplanes xinjiangensis]|jgi:hypothetical protein|uniref:Uncharacterized protein n=1 Tax=Actinoplanes xinjiangensis TaxID=512350 RepID=A0A316G7Y3_9ACTN|nr:hypothetical protein BC793_103473 [Actinoplanes xinjiangensis]